MFYSADNVEVDPIRELFHCMVKLFSYRVASLDKRKTTQFHKDGEGKRTLAFQTVRQGEHGYCSAEDDCGGGG